jgi:hypothetical protein
MKMKTPTWIRYVLWIAGLYNIAFGILIVSFPLTLFRWGGLDMPRYPQIWQCVGMIVGVYGVGYAIAAEAPFQHWPIVLVGLLGKVFGSIGFLCAAMHGELPWVAGWVNVFNDLIWLGPFAVILWHVHRAKSYASRNKQRTPVC